jgi:VWFA-related protein
VSARTDVVTLVVTVVDRKGTHVTGLRPEHFTVYDNGEPQAIQFFTSEDLPATIGLVVDSSGSTRNRRDEVTAAAMAFATISHPNGEFFIVNFNETVWPGLAARSTVYRRHQPASRGVVRGPGTGHDGAL